MRTCIVEEEITMVRAGGETSCDGVRGEVASASDREIEVELRRVRELMKVLEKPVVSQMPDLSGEVLIREQMHPARPASSWDVLQATDFAELADGLGFHRDDLGWLTMRAEANSHYHYIKYPKRDGKRAASSKFRNRC